MILDNVFLKSVRHFGLNGKIRSGFRHLLPNFLRQIRDGCFVADYHVVSQNQGDTLHFILAKSGNNDFCQKPNPKNDKRLFGRT